MAQKRTLISLFSARDNRGDHDDFSLSPPASFTFPATDNVIQTLATADAIISKWDTAAANGKVTSLLCESREEATEYLRLVANLQAVMCILAEGDDSSPDLVRGKRLLETAMKTLEREFFHILRLNRENLDFSLVLSPSSTITLDLGEGNPIGDEISDTERAALRAVADLRSTAESMIGSGHGNECAKVYTVFRKSVVDEGLYRLGIEPFSSAQIQMLDWNLAEVKIKGWTHAVKVAVKTLFSGERILCDHVFAASEPIRELCFSDITKDRAHMVFSFPEAAAKGKKSPEKIFRMLDLYDSIADVWPEVFSIFVGESFSSVRAQAESSRMKLGEAVRTMILDFEEAIQKDWSKVPLQGCALHPLSRYVMNFISVLADYRHILAEITAGSPTKASLPGEIADRLTGDPISAWFAWLILLLLCKLDVKADLYRDVPLSYLFLTNNLQYVIRKVESSDLRLVLGDSWIQMHTDKLRQYAASFERTAWGKSLATLAEIRSATTVEAVKRAFQEFNSAFDQSHRMKTINLVVTDAGLREEMKASVTQKIVPTYRSLYDRFKVLLRTNVGEDVAAIRFTPEDVENYISDFFDAGSGRGSTG